MAASIAAESATVVDRGAYRLGQSRVALNKRRLQESRSSAVMYQDTGRFPPPPPPLPERALSDEGKEMVSAALEGLTLSSVPATAAPSTRVVVFSGDSFEAAAWLLAQGPEGDVPMVLDFASDTNPGGGYRGNQTGTQEESLCRRSNLGTCLEALAYPMTGAFSAAYVPDCCVFRGVDLSFLPVPFWVAVCAAALRSVDADDEAFALAKIEGVLRVAMHHGHWNVVLGAWGCGAFGGDPVVASRCFRRCLESPPFRNAFRVVVFAIPTGENRTAFEREFNGAEMVTSRPSNSTTSTLQRQVSEEYGFGASAYATSVLKEASALQTAAEAAERAGALEQAAEYCTLASEQRGNWAQPYLMRARLLVRLGDPHEALKCVNQGIKCCSVQGRQPTKLLQLRDKIASLPLPAQETAGSATTAPNRTTTNHMEADLPSPNEALFQRLFRQLKKAGLSRNCCLWIGVVGSSLWGSRHWNSDLDLVVIHNSSMPKLQGKVAQGGSEFDCSIVHINDFVRRARAQELSSLLCFWHPAELLWLQKAPLIELCPLRPPKDISPPKLCENIINDSEKDWKRVIKSVESKNVQQAQRSAVCAVRNLMLGIQLIENSCIVDWKCADSFRAHLLGADERRWSYAQQIISELQLKLHTLAHLESGLSKIHHRANGGGNGSHGGPHASRPGGHVH